MAKEQKQKEKVVVILGPTATGKSHCAIELAKSFHGEIISGDSMLVYRDMNIGTAKPTAEELAAVPHHLVNILPPEASFTKRDAMPPDSTTSSLIFFCTDELGRPES